MINYILQQNIEVIANELVENELSSPIDIIKVAAKLNCCIEIVDFEPNDFHWHDLKNVEVKDVYAKMSRNSSKSKYTIKISRSLNEKRRRFSIAYEISNLILYDLKEGTSFIHVRQPTLFPYILEDFYKEAQANVLARAILLPKRAIIRSRELFIFVDDLVDDLFDLFNVSKEVIVNRLSNLGMLDDKNY